MMRKKDDSGLGSRLRATTAMVLHAIGALLASTALAAPAAADAVGVLVNADIRTMNPDAPRAEALAWGVDGRLLAVGSADAITERWPAVDRMDAGGRLVIPGLIDAHAHVMGQGLAMLDADLAGADSIDEILGRLTAHAESLPEGAWLRGRGWDQTRWDGDFPTAADLDATFPDRPVLLERVDGHASWANSAAMRRIERDLSGEWQPEGGFIHRDDDGAATGVFIDKAADLFTPIIPELSEAEQALALERALEHMVSLGLTGVHDAGTSLASLRRFLHRQAAGKLPLRIYAMADGDSQTLAALCRMGPVDTPRVVARGVKLYADGALGSRGAALLHDYHDDPGNRGLLFETDAGLRAMVDRSMDCGLQLAIHAIGDRANRQVIDVLSAAQQAFPENPGRHRIEHVQIVHPDDIERIAAAGLIASMQPTHATSDMRWAEQRLGEERLFGAYAWQRLRAAGARLAFGSDFPVEKVDPMLGLYAAVTRQDLDGEPPGGWLPDQRVTMQVALEGFTIQAAWAAFAEDRVGSLEVGKFADFVVLDRDLFEIEPAEIPAVDVLRTVVGGRTVYASAE